MQSRVISTKGASSRAGQLWSKGWRTTSFEEEINLQSAKTERSWSGFLGRGFSFFAVR